MRTLKLALATIALASSVTTANAEPIGRWWAGFGQGNFEYGINNDSAGSDTTYIGCGEGLTYVSFTVGGVQPKEGATIIVTIGADEFEFRADSAGNIPTASHVDSENFHALWVAIRAGQFMRVRLNTGQSTVFTLKGAAKTMPSQACQTDFER